MKLSNACNYTTSGVKDQLYIVQLTTNKQTNKQKVQVKQENKNASTKTK